VFSAKGRGGKGERCLVICALCRILKTFKLHRDFFASSSFLKLKIHGTFQKLCLELAAGFFRCVARKKRFKNNRLNHMARGPAQSARLNHTDGWISCVLLQLLLHMILALVWDLMEGFMDSRQSWIVSNHVNFNVVCKKYSISPLFHHTLPTNCFRRHLRISSAVRPSERSWGEHHSSWVVFRSAAAKTGKTWKHRGSSRKRSKTFQEQEQEHITCRT